MLLKVLSVPSIVSAYLVTDQCYPHINPFTY
jgi:hypothetical protein